MCSYVCGCPGRARGAGNICLVPLRSCKLHPVSTDCVREQDQEPFCPLRSNFSNIGPSISRNPVRQVPSVTVEELSSIIAYWSACKAVGGAEKILTAPPPAERHGRRAKSWQLLVLGATGALVSGPKRWCSTTFQAAPWALARQGFDIWACRACRRRRNFRPVRTQSGETPEKRGCRDASVDREIGRPSRLRATSASKKQNAMHLGAGHHGAGAN
jgi:hypothetical protein